MDPRTMRMLGITFQAPAEGGEGEDGGGADRYGDADIDGEDTEEGEEAEDGDETEDDADDDEGDEADGDGTEEGEQADEDEDEGDDALGERAQKRIKKLIAGKKDAEARVQALEKQLDEAKKLSGDDGKAIMKAAERSGILPGLMSKEEAEAFANMDQYRNVIRGYENWLDNAETDDEYDIGDGKSMSYSKVERRVRKLKDELQELKETYGGRRKDLEAKVRKIFEAGVEALKSGKKPDKAKKPDGKTKKLETRPSAKSAKPKREGRGGADDMEVEDEDSLEAFIMADRRKNR